MGCVNIESSGSKTPPYTEIWTLRSLLIANWISLIPIFLSRQFQFILNFLSKLNNRNLDKCTNYKFVKNFSCNLLQKKLFFPYQYKKFFKFNFAQVSTDSTKSRKVDQIFFSKQHTTNNIKSLKTEITLSLVINKM